MTEKKFIELYHRQKESGLTVKDFCNNEVIAPSTFYLWQKKLRSRNRLPGFIPVVVHPGPSKTSFNLLEESHMPSNPESNNGTQIEIEFSNKTIVRIKGGVDLSMLQALIHLND